MVNQCYYSRLSVTLNQPNGSSYICHLVSPSWPSTYPARLLTAMINALAAPLVNSSTPHSYSALSATFHQPLISSNLLSRFSAANTTLLKNLKTTREWQFSNEKVIKSGQTLVELCKAGGDERMSVAVLEALLEELREQTTFALFHSLTCLIKGDRC